jgi:hypothetical protein
MKSSVNKRMSLTAKAEAALHAAADKTVSQARMNKKTLVVWRNGQVVRLGGARLRKQAVTKGDE